MRRTWGKVVFCVRWLAHQRQPPEHRTVQNFGDSIQQHSGTVLTNKADNHRHPMLVVCNAERRGVIIYRRKTASATPCARCHIPSHSVLAHKQASEGQIPSHSISSHLWILLIQLSEITPCVRSFSSTNFFELLISSNNVLSLTY